jgi:hypothetical protein
MPANYVLLEKITVGAAGASSVTFSAIPQTGYTDLIVKASMRSDVSGVSSYARMTFNGVTSNASAKILLGNGSNALSFNSPSYTFAYVSSNFYTASTFGNAEFYIPNYASSTTSKSLSIDGAAENNGTEGIPFFTAGLWASTAPITSITLASYNNSTDAAANFVQGSTFYLYGVAKLGTTPAIVPYATGGDTIMTDGTYWYHTFLSSGTFTPAVGKNLSCDYLVVAGGGGGGNGGGAGGGGGGGGGYKTSIGGSALSLGTSAVTVTVGAGGAASTGFTARGSNGSNSVFSTVTSTGGGGGGSFGTDASPVASGSDGGSGGGGGFRYTGSISYAGGAASPSGQGNAGGSGNFDPNNGGGGGGGAGAAGVAGSGNTAGNGGNGTANSISGSSVTYAGGGGGATGASYQRGTGGTGGGGNGEQRTGLASTAGTANLGGGGGGGADTARAGGSGIVIVRYAV